MAHALPDKWIWDSWFVQADGLTHAFYLHASRALGDPERRHLHPIVGHATSTDLVHWAVRRDALIVSEPPAFDDGTTWTGSVIRADDGLWWMFYTGTSLAENRMVQRIGAATSTDLDTWEKRDLLVEADRRYYEKVDNGVWPGEAWRDPWLFRFPGETRWHMLVTARGLDGTVAERGVLGHATSDDLVHWSPQPPLSATGQGFGQMEVVQFEIVDGVPILLFCCGRKELGATRLDEPGGVYSLPVDERLEAVDFTRSVLFERTELYAARLLRDADGDWVLIGFVDTVDGGFVGGLSDPVKVTADARLGLVIRPGISHIEK